MANDVYMHDWMYQHFGFNKRSHEKRSFIEISKKSFEQVQVSLEEKPASRYFFLIAKVTEH